MSTKNNDMEDKPLTKQMKDFLRTLPISKSKEPKEKYKTAIYLLSVAMELSEANPELESMQLDMLISHIEGMKKPK
jgi:hypothetical protein